MDQPHDTPHTDTVGEHLHDCLYFQIVKKCRLTVNLRPSPINADECRDALAAYRRRRGLKWKAVEGELKTLMDGQVAVRMSDLRTRGLFNGPSMVTCSRPVTDYGGIDRYATDYDPV
jgi:hypothetical protein